MAKSNGSSHPKSYSRFTLRDVEKLGVQLETSDLFEKTPSLEPSDWLRETLVNLPEIKLGSEKAKSEFIIAPIIRELVVRNQHKISVFSGYEFNVQPEQGLAGFCDYIFTREVKSPLIKSPIFFLAEAKNENLELGAGQCIAEMFAAQIFNRQEGKPTEQVFGAVTFGREWQFYRLQGAVATQDSRIYSLVELPRVLGILQFVIDKI